MNSNRRPTCTCSDQQLYLVGCECTADADAVIVRVFKDGYASDNVATLHVDGGVDVASAVRDAFGSLALISSVRRVFPEFTAAPVSDEHARYMTRGDNS